MWRAVVDEANDATSHFFLFWVVVSTVLADNVRPLEYTLS